MENALNRAKRIALLFPGQGAQYPGMGQDFARAYGAARQTFEEADDILQFRFSHLIFEGPQETLTETCNSQIAIYITSLALLRVLQQMFPLVQPYVCAGLSLGEYTALTAGGYLSFSDGLQIVRRRGEAMHAACQEQKGAMAVIIGLEENQVSSCIDGLNLPHDLWVANLNCPGQVVISGTLRGIELGCEALLKLGAKRALKLQVAGAFHSGLMRSAEERLASHLTVLPLSESTTRLVMNVPGDFVKEPKIIRKNLIHQVTQPVRWEQGIRAMGQESVDLFVEVGPGKTLAGMNKRIGTIAPTLSVEALEDLNGCDQFFANAR